MEVAAEPEVDLEGCRRIRTSMVLAEVLLDVTRREGSEDGVTVKALAVRVSDARGWSV
jgi:hypothetical protein|eukprot:CAMPEP_0182564124 /NCGR_PEP_ID=MMETSP1324-20130603/6125_1 /TAXON_ID=236786 /ORGANISM="Florenciella sp., Strain RCC1587" /LENGTH=57 /DNA_ID=CAMNT_0024777495 /DNA_START=178 /DNA_END=351 /DNA_ORIENTATION=-